MKLRIISGRYRGRDLGKVPPGVRPTADRVRESLFAALGPIEGLRVLDLFAGTGALGLEAASRGASFIQFVEKSRKIRHLLEKRVANLRVEPDIDVQILGLPAEKALRQMQRAGDPPFDLVFVDPPYADLADSEVLETLVACQLLSADAVVVVEGPKRHALVAPAGLRIVDERIYGDTKLTWLGWAGPTTAR